MGHLAGSGGERRSCDPRLEALGLAAVLSRAEADHRLRGEDLSGLDAVELRRLLAVYTGASSPSFLSSFLSALCAVGHVQASADAASSIAASVSQVRIFHLGLSSAAPGQIQRGRQRSCQRGGGSPPHVHWARDQPFEPGG